MVLVLVISVVDVRVGLRDPDTQTHAVFAMGLFFIFIEDEAINLLPDLDLSGRERKWIVEGLGFDGSDIIVSDVVPNVVACDRQMR